jgi:ribosome-associated heat shock protein Hsp15
LYRTRSLAAQMVASGKVRINSRLVKKPGTAVRAGDVLTVVQGRDVRVVRVTSIAVRRGPAEEARQLYAEDDSPE